MVIVKVLPGIKYITKIETCNYMYIKTDIWQEKQIKEVENK